ncbi:hypothetical protein DSO57_1011339 [Entomophthora muscae]|uniref:Uncharacterized protein n=1 Tax=Entomophthora muscae TaxID=34485 RepID=A0ACC2U410_9FUNG|nr:hypothetical protein DSO57_1011339 [Entomophthora muscae]
MDDSSSLNQPLNVADLENIQSRLLAIRESLDNFYKTVSPEFAPGFAPWGDVLSKFNLLVARFVSYNNEISRSSLYQKMLVHPIQLDLNETEAHILGFMLRTKQIPEIEKEEEALISSGLPGIIENEEDILKDADNRQLEQIHAQWQTQIQKHDAIAEQASEAFDNMLRTHNFKKRPIAQTIPQDTPDEASDSSPASPKRPDFKGSSKSLDQILGWYSSGRRFDS